MTTIKLSARFGEHEGHAVVVHATAPKEAFLFACSCGAWFRISPEEARKGGSEPYRLEPVQVIEAP